MHYGKLGYKLIVYVFVWKVFLCVLFGAGLGPLPYMILLGSKYTANMMREFLVQLLLYSFLGIDHRQNARPKSDESSNLSRATAEYICVAVLSKEVGMEKCSVFVVFYGFNHFVQYLYDNSENFHRNEMRRYQR